MVRIASPVDTPATGDCFFHVVAHARGNPLDDVDAAAAERRAVAAHIASVLYSGTHYADLAALTKKVRRAASGADMPAVSATGAAAHLASLKPVDEPAQPRNGERVPLAAWVVWLQYSSAEVKAARDAFNWKWYLLSRDFLKYTLWGDMALVGTAVFQLYGRPLEVYSTGRLLEQATVNPINFFHLPSHFAAVEFGEEEVLRLRLRSTVRIAFTSVTRSKLALIAPCEDKKPKLRDRLFLVDPANLPSTTSVKFLQYADPGITVPETSAECLAACRIVLGHRRGVMRAQYRAVMIPDEVDLRRFPLPPVYVITSNRSKWLLKNLKKGTFYGRFIGTGRPIVLAVGEDEVETYTAVIKQKGQGPGEGVFVVGFPTGFSIGWNRHCALRHAKTMGLDYIWMVDDNVTEIKRGGKDIGDLPDAWLEQQTITTLYPGIMQQVLGFNLARLDILNFCPFLMFSKEDLSVAQFLSICLEEHAAAPEECSVIKADKDKIVNDGGQPRRTARMAEIAALDVWGDYAETAFLPSDVGQTPYQILKHQEQALYNCIIKLTPSDLLALAREWFVDTVTD